MKVRALVVEDSPAVVDEIKDVLFSLGHEGSHVDNLKDAVETLDKQHFDYILLDLEFPTRPNRGLAKPLKENGSLFLDRIKETAGDGQSSPVIVMSAHLDYCLNQVNEFREKGACEFIAKPFPTEGRTLTRVIRSVIKGNMPTTSRPRGRRFSGGDLVVFNDHAKLLGVKIISDMGFGFSLGVLKHLASQRHNGRYVPVSAETLANAIDADPSSVVASVRHLRGNIKKRLWETLKLKIEQGDVICRNEQGYFLHEDIVVGNGTKPKKAATRSVNSAPPSEKFSERQEWILQQVRKNTKLTRAMIELTHNVGAKTAIRDLKLLRDLGYVEYVRDGPGGFYRLTQSEKS